MRYFFLFGFLAVSTVLNAQVAIVNGASFRADQPVSAGSWVSAFGTFVNVGESQAGSLPLPKSLNGVTVTVDGVQAGINYVSSTQINFVIPYQTAAGIKTVSIAGPGGTVEGTVRIIGASPGLFMQNTAQPPLGAILNQDNSANDPQRPAIRGQAIQIYATGHSALAAALEDGAAAPSNPPVTTAGIPQVLVGGVDCPVEFSGLAPGFAALWQINCRIPTLSFLSGRLPVQVFMNGVDSNEVTVHVAP
jgi:uncharacterized protein (TIGR03437 family)